MVGKLLAPEIKALIDARDFNGLRELFKEWPPADVAEIILDLPEDEQVIIFRVLPAALAADVFEYIGVEEQQNFLRAMAHEQVVAILNEMSPDDRTVVSLKVNDSQEAALNLFRKYDRVALPVLDSNGVLVGIVTSDDMLDVAEEEATEDIQKLGGLEALDEPYTTIPFLRMVKKRATWLILLFLGEMLTATAMQGYNSEIERAAILAMFLPLIISSGGNSGSQATTLVIRAMALGELALRDWFQVVRKELVSGLSLGLILGTIGFFRISLWQYLHIFDYGKYHWLVAITVGVALVGVVLWGTISGAMLPFLLRRLGLDPAASSAPFVATLVHVSGLIIYFNVALFILRGTLL